MIPIGFDPRSAGCDARDLTLRIPSAYLAVACDPVASLRPVGREQELGFEITAVAREFHEKIAAQARVVEIRYFTFGRAAATHDHGLQAIREVFFGVVSTSEVVFPVDFLNKVEYPLGQGLGRCLRRHGSRSR